MNNTRKYMIRCATALVLFGLGAAVEAEGYVETILGNQKLIAYYRFTENPDKTATASDVSGNGHDGTYSGEPVAAVGPTTRDGAVSFGNDNPAVNFNGKGMLLLDPAPLDKELMTFTGFIQTSHTKAEKGGQRIYTTISGSNYQFTINIVDGTTLTVTVQRGTEGWTAAHADITPAMDGRWHHLVVSRGGNDWRDVRIWLDFEPVATTQGPPSGQGLADDKAVLGARSTHTANAFRGAMDEVAFFDGIVTQVDVDRLRQAVKTR